jgi:AraC-like DNA-binding protein
MSDGYREFKSQGKDHVAKAGDLICYQPGQAYWNRQAKTAWSGYNLLLDISESESPQEPFDCPTIIPNVSVHILHHLRSMSELSLQESKRSKRMLEAHIELFLSLLTLEVRPSTIDFLTQIILEQQDENLSLEDLAQRCSMSTASLKRLIKKSCQKTFSEFKRGIKINIAQQILLSEPDITLHQLATKCGFCDEYHLSRVFKKEVGYAPGHLRKRLSTGQL